jgi:hypothetical protein
MDYIKCCTPGIRCVIYTVRWHNGQDTLETRRSLQVYAPDLLDRFERELAGLPPSYKDTCRIDCLVAAARYLGVIG